MNHCRICLASVPDPKLTSTVDSRLSDGSTIGEKLDELFNILVGDYSDADVLRAICDQCVDKVTRSASGQLSPEEFEQIKDFLESGEMKARLYVRSGGQLSPNTPINNPALKVITNSPYGMTKPKPVVQVTATKRPLVPAATPKLVQVTPKRPLVPAAAATTSKKSKLQMPEPDEMLEWLRSQPGTAGLGGSTPTSSYVPRAAATKKVIVREIQLDQDDDDGRETVVKTKCPFCTKVYVLNSALMTHITNKHPEHPTKFKKCSNCNKNFLNAAELKGHKCAKAQNNYGRRSYGWFRRGYWW